MTLPLAYPLAGVGQLYRQHLPYHKTIASRAKTVLSGPVIGEYPYTLMNSRRLLTAGLKALASALLLLLVYRSVDAAKIQANLRNIETGRLLLILVVCWFAQLSCAQRWRLLAASLGMPGSYRSFVKMYYVGMLFNVGLPSLVGGDLIKAYIVTRTTGKPLQPGLASVLQDRAAGMFSLLIYGSLAILIFPMSWKGIPLWLVYLAAWIVIIMVIRLAWKGDRIYRRFLAEDARSIFQKVVRLIADFHQALITMRLSRKETLQVIIISFFNSGLVLWMFMQVTTAAGDPVGLIPFSALFPLITLLTLLPFSLLGVGIREWSYVEALAIVGVPGDRALIIALSTSAILIVSDLAGLFFLPAIPSELRRVTATEVDERG